MTPLQAIGCALAVLLVGITIGASLVRGAVDMAEGQALSYRRSAEAQRKQIHEMQAEMSAVEKMLAQQAFTIVEQEKEIRQLPKRGSDGRMAKR